MILVTASHFGDSSALPGFCTACAFRVCGMVISRELRNKLVLKVRLEFTRLYRRGLQPAHELVMSFSRCLLQTLNTQELLAYDANQWRPPWWNDVYFRNAFQVWPGDEWSPPGDDEEIAAFLKVKGKQNGIKERACHLFLATNLKELIATAKARQEEKCFQGLDLQSVLGRVAYACWKQLDPPKRKVYLDVAVYKMAVASLVPLACLINADHLVSDSMDITTSKKSVRERPKNWNLLVVMFPNLTPARLHTNSAMCGKNALVHRQERNKPFLLKSKNNGMLLLPKVQKPSMLLSTLISQRTAAISSTWRSQPHTLKNLKNCSIIIVSDAIVLCSCLFSCNCLWGGQMNNAKRNLIIITSLGEV